MHLFFRYKVGGDLTKCALAGCLGVLRYMVVIHV